MLGQYIWLVPVAPLAAFLIILFALMKRGRAASYTAIGAIAFSFVWSWALLVATLERVQEAPAIPWLALGSFKLSLGFTADPLAVLMLVIVSTVALMVQVFSLSYMHGEERFSWYYAVLSLFTAAMLSLVIADNLVQLLMSWEVMGLCSYLLIGFWFEKRSAADAAKKAFITTRIGDVGLFIGMMLLFKYSGTFNFSGIYQTVESGRISGTAATAAALLIFAGAVGKSAQFPLHVWLPDAMEGPTPVSALIHAATMVAAGVFLVARTYPLFEASHTAMLTVTAIGTTTMVMAALIALTARDIKKILAYSTISQLGYMVMALGVGGYTAAIFHLMTHAFFKSLMFLGSGSVIHATHTQDIFEMGGLRKKMPYTTWTFVIGALAIAGVPPLAGFWSKDAILGAAFLKGSYVALAFGFLTALLTAFYMFRLIFVVFFGEESEKASHAHESPWVMAGPLVFLAFLATVSGLIGAPFENNFSSFIRVPSATLEHEEMIPWLMLSCVVLAAAGIAIAWLVYMKKTYPAEAIARRFAPLYKLFSNKFYIDEFYDAVFVKGTLSLAALSYAFDGRIIDGLVNGFAWLGSRFSVASRWFDEKIVDGTVNGTGWIVRRSGDNLRYLQAGDVSRYALVFSTGVAILLLYLYL